MQNDVDHFFSGNIEENIIDVDWVFDLIVRF